MILTCPACATRYFVTDGLVSANGKAVRCASCQHRWMAYPDTDGESEMELAAPVDAFSVPEPPPAAEPEPPRPAAQAARAIRRKAETKKTVRAAVANGVVWAGIAAVFVTLIVLAVVFRVDIVRAVPRTASAYSAVGLPVNAVGLVFESVSAKPGLEDGHDALVVSGQVRNVEKHPIASPLLAIRLLDKTGHRLVVHSADPGQDLIAPGQTHNFVVSILDPPAGANDLEIAFGASRRHAPAPHSAPAHPVVAAAHGPELRGAAEADPPPVPDHPTPLMDLAPEAKPVADGLAGHHPGHDG